MAAFKKFGGLRASSGCLRHILREVKRPTNIDIDPDRTKLNYDLAPQRRMKPYTYLKKRLGELRCRDRADLNVMCGWVITKPKDLPEMEERRFFRLCYDFLIQRYGGEQNVVTAAVHRDESGESHLHFCFVPVTKHTPSPLLEKVVRYFEQHPTETNVSKITHDLGVSRKTVRRYRNCTAADIQREKVSAKEVVDRAELISFHPDLSAWLLYHGLDANVNSGITMEQGGNRTVAELKQERERLREQHTTTHEHEF